MTAAHQQQVREAVEALRAGRLVAFPTETVYGLGADAFDARAVVRVYDVKGRPARNPLIVHVSDAEMARKVVKDWPDEAQALATALWPGPISIVLPKRPIVPDIVTGGSPNVAVRCPDHPLTLALLREFGGPLVGPSANLSGSVSPTTAAHVRSAFREEDVLVLDGGPCQGGIESTVVTLAESPARILRPGLISAEQVSSVIRGPVVDFVGAARVDAGETPLESPGLLERHYAPATRAVLATAEEAAGLVRRAVGSAVVVSHVPIAVAAPHSFIQLPAHARGYAARLYAALREADARSAGVIIIVRPVAEGADAALWKAVLDRLGRATTR